MKPQTTLKEIASTLQLDVSTVSRALRGDKRVKPQTMELIRKTAKKLNYIPNLAARNLVAGKTNTILFILSSFDNINERVPCQRAYEYLAQAGYAMFSALGRDNTKYTKELLHKLQQGIADGAILIPGGNENSSILSQATQSGKPVVLIDRDIPGSSAPLITSDNAYASQKLVEWAASKGCRDFLLHFDETHNSVTTERLQSTQAAIRKCGGRVITLEEISSTHKSIALIGTNQNTLYQTTLDNPHIYSARELYFGVFDSWIGSCAPAAEVMVAVQDFSAIAREAARVILQMLEPENEFSHDKTTRIPFKEFKVISNPAQSS